MSGLIRQTVALPFAGGLDTKSDSRQTPVAKLQVLENATFTRPGSLRKRYGYRALSKKIANPFDAAAPKFVEGRGIASYKDELLGFDPGRMYSYDVGTDAWIDKGPMVSGHVTQQPVVRNIYGQANQDGVTNKSGLQLYAWEDTSGGVRYSIVDGTSGQTVVASTLVDINARKPKTLSIANFMVLLWVDVSVPTTPILKGALISAADPTAALVPLDVTAGGGGAWRQLSEVVPSYDAVVIQGPGDINATLYIAFSNNSSATGVTIFACDQSSPLSPFGSDHQITGTSYPILTIFADVATFGPVFSGWDGTYLFTQAYDPFVVGSTQTYTSLTHQATATLGTDISNITGVSTSRTVAGTFRIALSGLVPGAETYDSRTGLVKYDGYGAPVFSTLARSVRLMAKGWSYNGLAYFPLSYESPLDSTYFVIDENSNLVMRALSGLAGPPPQTGLQYAYASFTVDGTMAEGLSIQIGVYNPLTAEYIDKFSSASTAGQSISDWLQTLADYFNNWSFTSPMDHQNAVVVGNTLTFTQIVAGPIGVVAYNFHSSAPGASSLTVTNNLGTVHAFDGTTWAWDTVLPSAATSGQGMLPEVSPIDYLVPTELTAAVAATGTLTISGTAGGQVGATIGGTTVTVPSSQQVGVTVGTYSTATYWETSDVVAAGDLAAAMNADAGVSSLVSAVSLGSNTIYIEAVTPGVGGNSISYSPTGTGVAALGPTLTGGTDPILRYGTITISGGSGPMNGTINGNNWGPVAYNTDDQNTAVDIKNAILGVAPVGTTGTAVAGVVTIELTGTGSGIDWTGYGTGLSIFPNYGYTTNYYPAQPASGGLTLNNARGAGNWDALVAAALPAALNANPFIAPITRSVVGPGNTVVVTAVTLGVVGNAITFAGSGTGASASGATLAGGTDATYEYHEQPTWRYAALIRDLLTTIPGTTTTGTATTATYTQTGVTALTFESFNPTESYNHAILGQSLNIGGGFLSQYDGIKPVELGFHVFPELKTGSITTATSGGFLGNASQATSYWWSVCYSWTDNTGAVHRSAPSIPIEKTFSSGVTTGSASLSIPTLRLTAKTGTPSPVVIEVYRTIGTSPGVFYLASASAVPAASPATNQVVFNSDTVDRVVFVDNLSDAAIIGNPRLYTTGNVLESSAPPPCTDMVVFQNRLFGIDSTNPLVLFYSQEIIPGVAVDFSDYLTMNLDPKIGAATALGVLDEKLIIWGESKTFYVNGVGPDSTGAGNSYQPPQLIPGDIGCTNPRSVVSTDLGLMFETLKGLWLLNRGLGLDYIGAEVEQLVNPNTVTGAYVIPTTTQTRFTLDSGNAVVFDSLVRQWSTFTPMNAVGCTIWSNVFTYLKSDGTMLTETANMWSDNGVPIVMKLTTAPIRLTGLAGFQRVRLLEILGTFESPHTLDVSVQFDGNSAMAQNVTVEPATPPVWGDNDTWGSGEVWGGGARFRPYIYRVLLNKQKCSDLQVTISDKEPGNNIGEGVALSSLSLEIAAKTGLKKVGQTSTSG